MAKCYFCPNSQIDIPPKILNIVYLIELKIGLLNEKKRDTATVLHAYIAHWTDGISSNRNSEENESVQRQQRATRKYQWGKRSIDKAINENAPNKKKRLYIKQSFTRD